MLRLAGVCLLPIQLLPEPVPVGERLLERRLGRQGSLLEVVVLLLRRHLELLRDSALRSAEHEQSSDHDQQGKEERHD